MRLEHGTRESLSVPVRLHYWNLEAVLAVQLACYGSVLVEREDCYAERLTSPSACILGLFEAGVLQAYLAAYGSRRGRVTPLNGAFIAAAPPDTLYLHDLAVRPDQVGRGLASRLLIALLGSEQAAELSRVALVAVQGAEHYWSRLGLQVEALAEPFEREQLRSYGATAIYMSGARDDVIAALERRGGPGPRDIQADSFSQRATSSAK